MALGKEQMKLLYRNLVRADHFDKMMMNRIMQGKLIGFYHPGDGAMAAGVGASTFLGDNDILNPHHRAHGLGLETVGLKADERGFIPVGDYNQTTASGVFAIGDVTSTPLLAHVASRECELAVEFIAGHGGQVKRVDPMEVPSAIYCEPQVAGFGLREDEAKSRGIEIRKSVFPYRGIGKAVAVGKSGGLVKLIADPKTGEILGGHVVGLNATEILHEILLAKTAELLPEDITRMIHAHPKLSEGVMEAALGLTGLPIHT